MKTIKITNLFLGTALLASLASCTETVTMEDYRAGIENIVEADKTTRDSLETIYIATLDEIDNNLDKIRSKEGVIIMGPKQKSDVGLTKKEQVINNISIINSLLEDNKNKLSKLEKSLSAYKKGKKELLQSIKQAKERVALLDGEIRELKILLAQNEYKINDLNKQLDEKNVQLATMTEKNTSLDKDLNRVYFTEGTYKQLKNNNVIIKKGGMLGIGGVKTLRQNLDKSKFKELSQKETTSIVLNGKKPKLITQHPLSSYSVTVTSDNIAQLTIKDPNSFWSFSKYLVVEIQ